MRARRRESGGGRYEGVDVVLSPPDSPRSQGPHRAARRLGTLAFTFVVVVVLLLVGGSNGAPLAVAGVGLEPPPLRAVLLFKKPELSTGQLIPSQEGLDVLRAQKEPFSIIAAVGPTRTGKSSILGRAFLRGSNENLFEIGSGVTSHTGGVWISSRPIVLTPAGGGPPVRAFIVDTEGFSGVGGLTSRTYEANLFGMVYLMSSTVIFNSMYPVDASMVERMNAYGKRTLDVIAELNDYDVAVRAPSLSLSLSRHRRRRRPCPLHSLCRPFRPTPTRHSSPVPPPHLGVDSLRAPPAEPPHAAPARVGSPVVQSLQPGQFPHERRPTAIRPQEHFTSEQRGRRRRWRDEDGIGAGRAGWARSGGGEPVHPREPLSLGPASSGSETTRGG
jgi:hypothetical protein